MSEKGMTNICNYIKDIYISVMTSQSVICTCEENICNMSKLLTAILG